MFINVLYSGFFIAVNVLKYLALCFFFVRKFPFKRRGIKISGVIDSGQCFLSGRTPVVFSKDWMNGFFHKKAGFLVFL